jgi:DNA-binding NtrC family response regulator
MEPVMSNPLSKPLSILLVEDDPEFRSCLEILLKRTQHEVIAAQDVPTAIQLLQEQSFDVVVTDILIGDRDGSEVIAATRRKQPGAHIVAMSGGDTHLRPSYCLNVAISWGACAPLMKPFSFDDLIAAIENHPIAGDAREMYC